MIGAGEFRVGKDEISIEVNSLFLQSDGLLNTFDGFVPQMISTAKKQIVRFFSNALFTRSRPPVYGLVLGRSVKTDPRYIDQKTVAVFRNRLNVLSISVFAKCATQHPDGS